MSECSQIDLESIPFGYNRAAYTRKERRALKHFYPAIGISRYLLKHPITAATFEPNERKQIYFQKMRFCILDFDGTLLLEEAKRIFCDQMHIIALSDSHGINGIDKFRLIRVFEREITCPDECRYNLKAECDKYDADPQAKAINNQFFHCKEIVSYQPAGYYVDVRAPKKTQQKPEKLVRSEKIKIMPLWTAFQFSRIVKYGERDEVVFGVIKDLFKCGYDYDQIFSKTLKLKLEQPTGKEITEENIREKVDITWKRLMEELERGEKNEEKGSSV